MNIYVAGLSYQINDDELRQIFEEYGEVSSAKVITDKYSGKSRGFGFVEMPSDEDAEKAIANLNEKEFQGKTITVNKARPKTDSDRGGGRQNFNKRY